MRPNMQFFTQTIRVSCIASKIPDTQLQQHLDTFKAEKSITTAHALFVLFAKHNTKADQLFCNAIAALGNADMIRAILDRRAPFDNIDPLQNIDPFHFYTGIVANTPFAPAEQENLIALLLDDAVLARFQQPAATQLLKIILTASDETIVDTLKQTELSQIEPYFIAALITQQKYHLLQTLAEDTVSSLLNHVFSSAAKLGHIEIIRALNPYVGNEVKQAATEKALIYRQCHVAEHLTKQSIFVGLLKHDPNQETMENIIYLAISQHAFSIIESLFAQGLRPDFRLGLKRDSAALPLISDAWKQQHTLLMLAASANADTLCEYFLNQGVDASTLTHCLQGQPETALEIAVRKNHATCVKVLVKNRRGTFVISHEDDPTVFNLIDGRKLLVKAFFNQQLYIVETLLESTQYEMSEVRTASTSAMDATQESPLCLPPSAANIALLRAIRNCDKQAIYALLGTGNETIIDTWALLFAAQVADPDIINLILHHDRMNLDINSTFIEESLLLLAAARYGSLEMLNWLMHKKHISKHIRPKTGSLHWREKKITFPTGC